DVAAQSDEPDHRLMVTAGSIRYDVRFSGGDRAMATNKKEASDSPQDTAAEAPAVTRPVPSKPRNIAAYEAAVDQFTAAASLFSKGQFAEAKPIFDAIAAAT